MRGAVHRLAQREGRTVVSTLLLAGIALNALCGATVGLLTYIASDAQLRNVMFWSLGSVGGVTWSTVAWLGPLVLLPAWGLHTQRRILNALLLGEAEAGHLGFHVERGKRIILLCTTLMVGATVACAWYYRVHWFGRAASSTALDRPMITEAYWRAPPFSARFLLLLADTIARLVVIPAELPIGIVTALCGAPFFSVASEKGGPTPMIMPVATGAHTFRADAITFRRGHNPILKDISLTLSPG